MWWVKRRIMGKRSNGTSMPSGRPPHRLRLLPKPEGLQFSTPAARSLPAVPFGELFGCVFALLRRLRARC